MDEVGPIIEKPQAPDGPVAEEKRELSRIVRVGILFGAGLAVMIQSLDATIAAVALPHMQGSLSASQDEIAWVITSYITAAAIFTAPAGWFADRFGIKRTLIVAMTGFTIASVLTGMVQTLDQAVLFRLLQGAFGAPLVPVTQALILTSFEAKAQPRALSWWTLGISLGPILGPNIGGWLTDELNWRWVFFVNLPIGLVCLVLLFLFVPKDRPRPRGFDWFGFAAAALFIGCLQLALDRGSEKDWFGSPEIVAWTCLAGLGLYLTIVNYFTSAKPLIDFGTLRDGNFVSGTVFTMLFSMLYMSSTVLTPAYFQGVLGHPVALSGLLMAPRFVGVIVIMVLFGSVGSRVDARLATLFGVLVVALGHYQMSGWSFNVAPPEIVWTGLYLGFGWGIALIAMQAWTFANIPVERRNGAATVFGLGRNLGQSVGVSVMTAMLIRNLQINHAEIAAKVTPFNAGLQAVADRHGWNLHRLTTLTGLDGEVTRQASLIAYLDGFKAMMFIGLGAVPLIFLMRKPTSPAVAKAQTTQVPTSARTISTPRG